MGFCVLKNPNQTDYCNTALGVAYRGCDLSEKSGILFPFQTKKFFREFLQCTLFLCIYKKRNWNLFNLINKSRNIEMGLSKFLFRTNTIPTNTCECIY